MPLQFFDDIADETHGDKLAGKNQTAKGFCRRKNRLDATGENFHHGLTQLAKDAFAIRLQPLLLFPAH
jgi:hypothetical protein